MKERRALTPGRSLCGRCRGSGVVTPTGSSERVCPRCLGKGYLISRDLSTGSWFEDISRKIDRHKDAGQMMTPHDTYAKRLRTQRGIVDD